MKKLFIALCILALCSSAYAGGVTDSKKKVIARGGVADGGAANYGLSISYSNSDIISTADMGNQTSFDVYGLIKVTTMTTADKRLMLIRDLTATAAEFRLNEGTVEFKHGTASCTVGSFAADTTYIFRMTWTQSSGSDGTYSFEFNESALSGDGADYCGGSDGTSTRTPNNIMWYPQGPSGGAVFVMDALKVDTSITTGGACTGACLFEEQFDGEEDCYTGDTTYNNCDNLYTVSGSPDFQATSLD